MLIVAKTIMHKTSAQQPFGYVGADSVADRAAGAATLEAVHSTKTLTAEQRPVDSRKNNYPEFYNAFPAHQCPPKFGYDDNNPAVHPREYRKRK